MLRIQRLKLGLVAGLAIILLALSGGCSREESVSEGSGHSGRPEKLSSTKKQTPISSVPQEWQRLNLAADRGWLLRMRFDSAEAFQDEFRTISGLIEQDLRTLDVIFKRVDIASDGIAITCYDQAGIDASSKILLQHLPGYALVPVDSPGGYLQIKAIPSLELRQQLDQKVTDTFKSVMAQRIAVLMAKARVVTVYDFLAQALRDRLTPFHSVAQVAGGLQLVIATDGRDVVEAVMQKRFPQLVLVDSERDGQQMTLIYGVDKDKRGVSLPDPYRVKQALVLHSGVEPVYGGVLLVINSGVERQWANALLKDRFPQFIRTEATDTPPGIDRVKFTLKSEEVERLEKQSLREYPPVVKAAIKPIRNDLFSVWVPALSGLNLEYEFLTAPGTIGLHFVADDVEPQVGLPERLKIVEQGRGRTVSRTVINSDEVLQLNRFIAETKIEKDRRFHEPYLAIRLNEAGGVILSKLTEANVGRRLGFLEAGENYIGGARLISAPVIREKISDGRLQLSIPEYKQAEAYRGYLISGNYPGKVTMLGFDRTDNQ